MGRSADARAVKHDKLRGHPRYLHNPLVHRDRRLERHASPWARSFACDDLGVLIVCRGPIRKEAIDVLREMGVSHIGILLSEKDSIVYPRALSPELRMLEPSRVHLVPDYSGATKLEREARIAEMIRLCRVHKYGYVFAGYGFMAEDADFVAAIEQAGLVFVGPGSPVQRAAGAKDAAKRTAIANDVSVTPGVDDATARTVLRKAGGRAGLPALAASLALPFADDPARSDREAAEALLSLARAARKDAHSIDELCETLRLEAAKLLSEQPGRRFRLKAIGGGGGKGQRIFGNADDVPTLARECLAEVKANGVGDDKNLLLELNVEATRHNEIQLLGNGRWCVTLGGRDCSLQMHEQKLVELSITQEGFAHAIDAARAAGATKKAEALAQDLATLRRMEAEAERFGRAVKLDSASTFECIVEGPRHYFMEVNTRIQVEHRVSELCYGLRFQNPDDPREHFDVHSLVEAMFLIARHGQRLPKPTRVPREGAALEARLNATDRALQPAAGGIVLHWSDPIEGEIRDDQGISLKNPDTGLFMRYRIAGAYDSNVALLLTTGADRQESWERLVEVFRKTSLRGPELATNLEFHYGILAWFLARDVWARPTTKFVVPYLTLVGELKQEADALELEVAFAERRRLAVAAAGPHGKPTAELYDRKQTLICRPIAALLADPHLLSAWLSTFRDAVRVQGGRVRFSKNPVDVLTATYHLLHLDEPNEPPALRIWDHDEALLATARRFYRHLTARAPAGLSWEALQEALASATPLPGFDAPTWAQVRAAHAGHQAGLELLGLLPLLAHRVDFEALRLADDLTVEIPERLLQPKHQEAMRKVLVPPPATKADEIVAAMGGMFYGQEAPHLPPFVTTGSHFDRGQPLYIIEVMKMFNKVPAPFAGRIDEVLVHGEGTIVRKGQPLFRITPDERLVEEEPAARAARLKARTLELLGAL